MSNSLHTGEITITDVNKCFIPAIKQKMVLHVRFTYSKKVSNYKDDYNKNLDSKNISYHETAKSLNVEHACKFCQQI